MAFLLDTNVCVAILAEGWGVLVARAQTIAVDQLVISAITVWELEGGCALSSRAETNRARLDALLRDVKMLPFGRTEARHAGELYAQLEQTGLRLQTADCLIAGQALASGLTLVTQDSDFNRVKGLRTTDWLPPGYRRTGKK